MGAAVSIGLSLSDFFLLTPAEFAEVWRYNIEREKDAEYDRWNLMRYHASILIQPHLAKGKTMPPDKLLPLPRDKKQTQTEKVSKEEKKRRLAKRLQQLKQLEQTEEQNGSEQHNISNVQDNGC